MRRVKRPADKEEVFVSLTKSETQPNFETYKDIFMLAACLGHSSGKEAIPFTKSSEAISWEVFGDMQQSMIKIIALAETEDPKILVEGDDQGDRMLNIVEGYANRGLEILERKILASETAGADRLDKIIELLMSAYPSEDDQEENILKEIMG